MRSDSQQAGRRRHGGPRRPRYNNGRTSSENTPVKPPQKLGFFARIIAFFTRKKAKPQPAANGSRSVKSEPGFTERQPVSQSSAQPKSFRKPELVEVTSSKVYVGNLSFDAAESDLFELFAGVGSVQNAEIVSHRDTQKSKGFAFVTMMSLDEAKRAVSELHDKEFMGRRLVVSGAKTNDVRDSR